MWFYNCASGTPSTSKSGPMSNGRSLSLLYVFPPTLDDKWQTNFIITVLFNGPEQFQNGARLQQRPTIQNFTTRNKYSFGYAEDKISINNKEGQEQRGEIETAPARKSQAEHPHPK